MGSPIATLRQLRAVVRTQGADYAWRLVRPSRTSRDAPGRLVLIGPRLESSGAPLVLLDIMRDFAGQRPDLPLALVAPLVDDELVGEVDRLGVHREPALRGVGPSLIARQLRLSERDAVLLNTANVPAPYRDHVFDLLEADALGAAVWFLHEMEESYFEDTALVARTAHLLADGRLHVVAPSRKAADYYKALFRTERVGIVRLRVTLPPQHQSDHSPADFRTLRFCSVGTSQRGYKGQFLTIAALATCVQALEADPERYREFTLDLVGAKEDTYYSRQMTSVAHGLLGDRATLHAWTSRAEVVAIEARCNVTLGSSYTETFGLSMAEGMLLGHVLLRNATGGVDEQLRHGVNGYLIDPTDVAAYGRRLRELLDREKTPDERLTAMGLASRELSEPFTTANYASQLGPYLAPV
ncbi:MAG: glycosyltransferase family 4 protein [Propionicimonas sp.]